MTDIKKEVNGKLKIGLLIDDYMIPYWAYDMIKTINNSKHSSIALIVRKREIKKNKGLFIVKAWKRKKEILFLLYTKLENKFFAPNPNAFELKNLKNIVDCSELVIRPKEFDLYDIILDKDIEIIQKQSIDVFIKLGFRVLKGSVFGASKYGVWSYYHGDRRTCKGDSHGTWEMFEKRFETGVGLEILSEGINDGIKLFESFYTTHNLFLNKNKSNFYLKSNSMLPRKLDELFSIGKDDFFKKLEKRNTEPQFYYNRFYSPPNNWETLSGLLRLYWNAFNRVSKRLVYFEQWVLMFKFNNTEELSQSFYEFKRLIPPKDRFWADPFIIQKNNKYYIFFEELIYSEDKGKIVVIEMDEHGNHSDSSVVLETDYHLSYPYLIEDKGELYMLPETEDNNTIELYKCINFPTKWKLVKTMIKDIKAVDSTLFKHHGKYWLFTSVREYEGYSMQPELFLFYSDSLLEGEWIPHPQNPLISNHSFSRPAGNIFTYKDRIFRPAQNCSKHYGYGMQIREIITLNELEYEEKQVQSILPNWEKDLVSTHTLNSIGKLTFIDALIKRRK